MWVQVRLIGLVVGKIMRHYRECYRDISSVNPLRHSVSALALRLVHTTLQICCNPQQTVAFLKGDRKFAASTATVTVTCVN